MDWVLVIILNADGLWPKKHYAHFQTGTQCLRALETMVKPENTLAYCKDPTKHQMQKKFYKKIGE